jgi:hypothetical protein
VTGHWGIYAQSASDAGAGSQSEGRFQIASAASNGKTTEIYVLDTITSEVWITSPTDGTKWPSKGSPVKANQQDPATKDL